MGDVEGMDVECGQCHQPLEEWPSDTERQPCPHCGSMTRHINVFLEDQVICTSVLGHKAKRGGKGKPFSEGKTGDNWSQRLGRFVKLVRHIDRDNDSYTETVTDPTTGEIIHHCSEPLSQHRGHGADKKNK